MSEPEFFPTDDMAFLSSWEWVMRAIGDAATRVGSAIAAGLGSIGAALMFGADHGGWAGVTLAVSAVFAVIFAV